MAMVINSNIASLTAQRHLSNSRDGMEVAMERMASGSRINSSMDDAAGLAIANRMTSQVEGLNQAIRNANDAISLAQTAEATLDAHSDVLQRMRVLAVQAANDTYSTLDRKTLNNEIIQLKEELNRSVSKATFNGQKILDGTNMSFTFQIGHTSTDNVTVQLADMSGSKIGTQTWSTKETVTIPTGTVTTGTAFPKEADFYTINADVASANGSLSFTYGDTKYSVAYQAATQGGDSAQLNTLQALKAEVDKHADISLTILDENHFVITAAKGSTTHLKTGLIGGTTDGTAPITGSKIDLVDGSPVSIVQKEVDLYTLKESPAVASGKLMKFTYGGNDYTGTNMTNLVKAISDADNGIVATKLDEFHFTVTTTTALNTQMTKGTLHAQQSDDSYSAATGQTMDLAAGVANVTVSKDVFDFSTVEISNADRVSMTVNGKTYYQEFITDRDTTLNALGALVVNSDPAVTSKSVTGGVMTFEGGDFGTPTVNVETGVVKAKDSIDDILIIDSASAKAALAVVDSALEMMADFRSRMGAMSNRLYHSVDNLMNVSENTAAARSRIEDADFARESANLAKAQVLQQAGTAMLAQANASTKDIMTLLK